MAKVFNVFKDNREMIGHMVVLGKNHAIKNKGLKEMVGMLLQDGKKVVWFHPSKMYHDLNQAWNTIFIQNEEQMNKSILEDYSLIFIHPDFTNMIQLQKLLFNNPSEWVIVKENLDELIINYEQNEMVTQLFDFIHYISTFGQLYQLYTLVSASKMDKILSFDITQRIVNNSKHLLFFSQSKESLKYLKKMNWLTKKQLQTVQQLKNSESFYIQKS